MAATLDISCPHCAKAFKVPAELAGKTIRCKGEPLRRHQG